MDPDTALGEMLDLASAIFERAEKDPTVDDDAFRLAQLVLDLNTWIIRDGFLPTEWRES